MQHENGTSAATAMKGNTDTVADEAGRGYFIQQCSPSSPTVNGLPDTPTAEPLPTASPGNAIRRVLSTSWQALASRRGALHKAACATMDRSAHVLRNPEANKASGLDLSVRSHASHCSAASAASHVSLYDIDGLPEDPAPKILIKSPPLLDNSASGGVRNTAQAASAAPPAGLASGSRLARTINASTSTTAVISEAGGSNHTVLPQSQPQSQSQPSDPNSTTSFQARRAGADPSTGDPDPELLTAPMSSSPRQQHYHHQHQHHQHPHQHPYHQYYNGQGAHRTHHRPPQQPPQQQQPDPVALAATPSLAEASAITTGSSIAAGHSTEPLLQLAPSAGVSSGPGRQPPPVRPAPPSLAAEVLAAMPVSPRFQPPSPAAVASAVSSGGTYWTGPAVALAAAAAAAAAAEAALTAEPQPTAVPAAEAPASAAAAVAGRLTAGALSAAAGPAAAPPPPPSAVGPGGVRHPGGFSNCDDPSNPMSLYYDPSLDRHQQPPPAAVQPGAPYNPLAASPGRPAVTSYGLQPAEHPAGATLDDAAAAGAAATFSAAERSGTGGGGGNSATLVTDGGATRGDNNNYFVVLEMKESRHTPTTAAAAAAAFASGASASAAAPDAAAAQAGLTLSLRGRMQSHFAKWRGVGDTLMPQEQPVDVFWSWLGAFLAIAAVALLQQYLSPHVSLPLMIASFGASAVLLFGVPASKLAQPRNFLGGQIVSAVVGVVVRLIFTHAPSLVWLSASLGMSLSLAAMQLTRTVHPPGGASALIASSALNIGPWHGFKFVLTVFFGCLAMLAVAIPVNNLSSRRRYPTYWWGK